MSEQPVLTVDVRFARGDRTFSAKFDTSRGIVALVGPNGAGKSSVLSAILGAIALNDGSVKLGAHELSSLPVERRRIGFVPQTQALFPHLTVRQQLNFAARVSGSRASVDAVLSEFALTALRNQSVNTLSGGEKQRVALARAVIAQPHALLLDEPLAALDLDARVAVRTMLAERLAALKLPTVLVTHDPTEARALASQYVVLENGHVSQIGDWETLRLAPASPFVAQFTRTP